MSGGFVTRTIRSRRLQQPPFPLATPSSDLTAQNYPGWQQAIAKRRPARPRRLQRLPPPVFYARAQNYGNAFYDDDSNDVDATSRSGKILYVPGTAEFIPRSLDRTYHHRVILGNIGNVGATGPHKDIQLRYRLNAAGNFIDVTTTSDVVRAVDGQPDDGAAVLQQRLPNHNGPPLPFASGQYSETGLIEGVTIKPRSVHEFVFAFQLRSQDLQHGDRINLFWTAPGTQSVGSFFGTVFGMRVELHPAWEHPRATRRHGWRRRRTALPVPEFPATPPLVPTEAIPPSYFFPPAVHRRHGWRRRRTALPVPEFPETPPAPTAAVPPSYFFPPAAYRRHGWRRRRDPLELDRFASTPTLPAWTPRPAHRALHRRRHLSALDAPQKRATVIYPAGWHALEAHRFRQRRQLLEAHVGAIVAIKFPIAEGIPATALFDPTLAATATFGEHAGVAKYGEHAAVATFG